jgi:hypothetical protein
MIATGKQPQTYAWAATGTGTLFKNEGFNQNNGIVE